MLSSGSSPCLIVTLKKVLYRSSALLSDSTSNVGPKVVAPLAPSHTAPLAPSHTATRRHIHQTRLDCKQCVIANNVRLQTW